MKDRPPLKGGHIRARHSSTIDGNGDDAVRRSPSFEKIRVLTEEIIDVIKNKVCEVLLKEKIPPDKKLTSKKQAEIRIAVYHLLKAHFAKKGEALSASLAAEVTKIINNELRPRVRKNAVLPSVP